MPHRHVVHHNHGRERTEEYYRKEEGKAAPNRAPLQFKFDDLPSALRGEIRNLLEDSGVIGTELTVTGLPITNKRILEEQPPSPTALPQADGYEEPNGC